jgi:hypothetical protein
MPVISATNEEEIGLQFKATQAKELVRPYLNKQAGCGGIPARQEA